MGQAHEAEEWLPTHAFYGPKSIAMFLKVVANTRGHGVTFGSVKSGWEVTHHFGVGVDPGKLSEVFISPVPQD